MKLTVVKGLAWCVLQSPARNEFDCRALFV